MGKRIKLARSLLLLRAAHQTCGLTQLIGGPLCCFATLLLPRAALHFFTGIAQPVQRLGHTRVRRISTGLTS